MLLAEGLMGLQSITLLLTFPPFNFSHSLVFSLPPYFSSIPLVYHAPSWHLSEMEESILAIETHIDLLACSPHPNLLTPGRK